MTLAIRGARVSYGRRTVLDGLDITVGEGRLVGLLGPNGSGKSTLLKATCRILKPAGGTYKLNGRDLHALSVRDRAKLVAYVPQSTPPPFSLTVADAVMLGRTPHIGLRPTRTDWHRVDEALDQLTLTDLADRPLDELSGGQAQRVLLARALAQQPAVLLLDEPTSALDLRHQVETLTLVRNLTEQRHLRTLMAIHDLNLAARYCHEVALLHDGRVLTQGTPTAVYQPDLVEQVYGLPIDVDTTRPVPEVRPSRR